MFAILFLSKGLFQLTISVTLVDIYQLGVSGAYVPG